MNLILVRFAMTMVSSRNRQFGILLLSSFATRLHPLLDIVNSQLLCYNYPIGYGWYIYQPHPVLPRDVSDIVHQSHSTSTLLFLVLGRHSVRILLQLSSYHRAWCPTQLHFTLDERNYRKRVQKAPKPLLSFSCIYVPVL